MVWFTFTFLLGIPNNEDNDLDQKEEKFHAGQSYTEVEVSKPNFLCHIEYTLIPNEAPKCIDIICWNQAAKIYFENSKSVIIPLKLKKLRWIHFRVNHYLNFKFEDVLLFRSHNVKFSVSLGNKKFGEPAKTDKSKKFYGPTFSNHTVHNSIQKQIFQPLSDTLDDLPTVSYFKEHLTPQQQLYITLDTTLETSENFNKLFKILMDLSKEYHDENFQREPTAPYEDTPPLVNILQRNGANEIVGSKNGKDKKSDKKSMLKSKESENMEFSISGEQFLSGRKIFENCLKYNMEELPYVFCLGAVKNILSKVQAKIFNPLTIVISNLNNLPVNLLKKNGITEIKFRFLICNHLLAESNFIPIDKRMKINHARAIFTNVINKEKLLYFLQTDGLHIEVLGNLIEGQPSLRNTQRARETDEGLVILGVISADISSILFQPHRILLKCNFDTSKNLGASGTKENNIRFISMNEFNFCQTIQRKNENTNNPLGCPSISSPVLTIMAGLGHPLTDTWQTVTMNPDLFNRVVAVLYDVDLAIPIIQMIQDEADLTLGFINYVKSSKNVKRPLTKNYTENLINSDCLRKVQMTGFLMDCVDKIIIYAESSVFGGIQKVWAFTSCINPLQGHVLYDSSLIFLDRLYENLFQFGGFIGISLKEPPQTILSKPQSYNTKYIPKTALKALRCISSLTDCKSIKSAIKNNLFPDYASLVSLAIEFGSPIRISNEK